MYLKHSEKKINFLKFAIYMKKSNVCRSLGTMTSQLMSKWFPLPAFVTWNNLCGVNQVVELKNFCYCKWTYLGKILQSESSKLGVGPSAVVRIFPHTLSEEWIDILLLFYYFNTCWKTMYSLQKQLWDPESRKMYN